jgi:hypothetical protein
LIVIVGAAVCEMPHEKALGGEADGLAGVGVAAVMRPSA